MLRQFSKNARLLRCVLNQPKFPAIVPASRLLSSKSPDNVNKGASKIPSKDNVKESLKSMFNSQIYDRLVRNNKIVVFIKGTPQSPRCGFSNAVVQIFRMHGVEYEAHDVLADNELREGIKAYTDWPTIPQVFIDGEFVGGCDILLEMHQNGELVETLKKAGIESELLKLQKEAEKKLEQDAKSRLKSKKD